MRTNEHDPLRDLNWRQVYDAPTPEAQFAARLALSRIRAREKRKKQIVRIAACAACLAIAVGVGAFMLGNQQKTPDRIATPLQEMPALGERDVVYASMEDGFFHITPTCEGARSDAVQLKLVTAQEFEKTACPQCTKGIRLPEVN